MEINLLGLIAALTAFLTIWVGHVSVRKIEAETVNIWKPMAIAIGLGLALEVVALSTSSRPLSTVCGILGITLIWDAYEIKRQARRVYKGHAPANQANPRHAAMLADPSSHATTLNLLDRDPIGSPVEHDEAIKLVAEH
jgi:Domain of unknown function (DUF4491)